MLGAGRSVADPENVLSPTLAPADDQGTFLIYAFRGCIDQQSSPARFSPETREVLSLSYNALALRDSLHGKRERARRLARLLLAHRARTQRAGLCDGSSWRSGGESCRCR
jgi:hypothetical protein